MPTIGAHPSRLDLVTRPGEPIDFSVPVLDALAVPVESLAGWAAAAQIRAGSGPNAALLHEFDIEIETSSVRLSATSAQTWAWTFRSAPWDLMLTAPDGRGVPLVAGWVRHYLTATQVEPRPADDLSQSAFSAAFSATF